MSFFVIYRSLQISFFPFECWVLYRNDWCVCERLMLLFVFPTILHVSVRWGPSQQNVCWWQKNENSIRGLHICFHFYCYSMCATAICRSVGRKSAVRPDDLSPREVGVRAGAELAVGSAADRESIESHRPIWHGYPPNLASPGESHFVWNFALNTWFIRIEGGRQIPSKSISLDSQQTKS